MCIYSEHVVTDSPAVIPSCVSRLLLSIPVVIMHRWFRVVVHSAIVEFPLKYCVVLPITVGIGCYPHLRDPVPLPFLVTSVAIGGIGLVSPPVSVLACQSLMGNPPEVCSSHLISYVSLFVIDDLGSLFLPPWFSESGNRMALFVIGSSRLSSSACN